MKFTVLGAATAMAIANGAAAATIMEVGPSVGRQVALNPSDFVGAGPCGYGDSVVGDGCSVVLKTDPNSPDAYGRFDPIGTTWLDSQDLSLVTWTITSETNFRSLTIALTDAFDQPCRDDLGCSFFQLMADDATWSIPEQEANGTLRWLTVAFDGPVTTATLRFETRLNDGWGIVTALADATPIEPPAPVPLPASGALFALGLAGLAVAKRRKG